MRKVLFKALVVLAMGLYSLSHAQDATAASGGGNCGLNVMPCTYSDEVYLEYCLTTCGTPHWSCMVDPYQPYGPSRLYCHTGADQ